MVRFAGIPTLSRSNLRVRLNTFNHVKVVTMIVMLAAASITYYNISMRSRNIMAMHHEINSSDKDIGSQASPRHSWPGKPIENLGAPLVQIGHSFVEEASLVDISKACPTSMKINASNDHLPYSELLGFEAIRSVLKFWYEFNCPQKTSCTFLSIGQHLLHHAIKQNQTLLTVQVGAMDGISNDPMYEMFVLNREGTTKVAGRKSFTDLRNWLPVIIEPVPQNYQAMIETYTGISKTNSLGCAVPVNAAVSYDASKTSCPFCRVNTAEDAPALCKELPDWMKLQIGTLDCAHSERFHKKFFDLCVLQDPLPCSSITNLLSEKFIPSQDIAILQIDIEGYEYILFEGLLKEIPEDRLPPIIHFEQKVMIDQDKKHPLKEGSNTQMEMATKLMEDKGYLFIDEGEDILAIRF